MREDVDESPVYPTMSGDYSVTKNFLFGHSEVRGLVDYKAVDFDEAVGIDKGFDSFSRGHLSPRVLRLYLLRSAAELSLFSFLLKLIEPLRHAHWFEECEADSFYKSRGRFYSSRRVSEPSFTFRIL